MKKLTCMMLSLLMVFSMAACQSESQTVAAPTVEAVTTKEPPTEYVPDIGEISTFPSDIPDDINGAELSELYANFLNNYDWTPYNGFISEVEGNIFTYIVTDTEEYYETKEVDKDDKSICNARVVTHKKDNSIISFAMNEFGSYAEIIDTEEGMNYSSRQLRFTNKDTVSRYFDTVFGETIYDILYFETTWKLGTESSENEYLDYIVQNENNEEDIFMVSKINGTWHVYAPWGSEYENADGISFDVSTGVLTLPDKEMKVIIIQDANEVAASMTTEFKICGEAYVIRETHEIEYFEDLDRNTIVTPLKNAVIDFIAPENTTDSYEMAIANTNVTSIEALFKDDLTRYLGT